MSLTLMETNGVAVLLAVSVAVVAVVRLYNNMTRNWKKLKYKKQEDCPTFKARLSAEPGRDFQIGSKFLNPNESSDKGITMTTTEEIKSVERSSHSWKNTYLTEPISKLKSKFRRSTSFTDKTKFDRWRDRESQFKREHSAFYSPFDLESDNASSFHEKVRKVMLFQYAYMEERRHDDSIIIAVNATPTRGGGILYHPYRKIVATYSVDWRHVFNFNREDSFTFEIVNGLLAVEIFRVSLEIIMGEERDDDLLVNSLNFKVDSPFVFDDPEDGNRKEFCAINDDFMKQLATFPVCNVALQKSNKSFDHFIQIAEKLSGNYLDYADCLCSNYLDNYEAQCKKLKFQDSFIEEKLSSVVTRLKNLSKSVVGGDFLFLL